MDKNYKIVNVVGSSTINNINLENYMNILDSKYLQSGNHAIYYKSKKYNTTIVIYRSGKITFRGARGIEEAKESVIELHNKLRNAGIDPPFEFNINITNIVSVYDSKQIFNLEKIMISFKDEDLSYNPETFPGIVYKPKNLKTTALLFSKGKCIITGARSEIDIIRTIEQIHNFISLE
ncbi:MAG: hypothetical protein WCE94_03095 [Candidatus Methanoperedens sp.]